MYTFFVVEVRLSGWTEAPSAVHSNKDYESRGDRRSGRYRGKNEYLEDSLSTRPGLVQDATHLSYYEGDPGGVTVSGIAT